MLFCTITFYDTRWLLYQRKCQCKGTHFISLQAAVRWGEVNLKLLTHSGFWVNSTWVEAAAASCLMLYWSAAARPLERHQHASMASYKVEDEEDNGYETVDSPWSIASVVSLWCGMAARLGCFFSLSLAQIPVKKLSTILFERSYYTVLNHCSSCERKKKKCSVCDKHKNQMPQSCCSN